MPQRHSRQLIMKQISHTCTHSVIITHPSHISALFGSAIVSKERSDGGGLQVAMKRGHLLLSRVPIWREIKVWVWVGGVSII